MAKILVLDDVEDAVVMLKKILERKGHQIFGFTDEDEAISFAKDNQLDLAILDIKLQKMSGVEVLRKLKEYQPQIKVIMLTGYPTVESARESLSLGASEYCLKPIDKNELETKVAQVLKGGKAEIRVG
ncbi:response regulator [Thermosulfuriphilus ammonigenes]|uniref:Response regulator n=1 Tax=Thermosulfuriphilus ammonigenes TaxID=1936021 RepID=A0A6G7PUC3_9BACT|nr:response regulator [Thermosulfuriphilus ammonigenes]MBA2848746.1 DNA-binding NtrC family response regulator [Thermosulfuriphilus ammonigenes]QIJ71121.1 response regulator [Thermosulfuriphilus ammonigenes]HFB83510.1 response regulator [Thermodesulfatator sp.]